VFLRALQQSPGHVLATFRPFGLCCDVSRPFRRLLSVVQCCAVVLNCVMLCCAGARPACAMLRCMLCCAVLCCVVQVRNQLAIVRSSEYTLIKSRFDDLLTRQQKVGVQTCAGPWPLTP
jgi:hypothetical protein